jgi:hypothetical protein
MLFCDGEIQNQVKYTGNPTYSHMQEITGDQGSIETCPPGG